MASLIQLQNLSNFQSKPALCLYAPQLASARPKLSVCLLDLLFRNFYRPIIQYNAPIKSSFTINFSVPIFSKNQILVQCQINEDYSLMVMRSILINGFGLVMALSSEIIKNSCRTIALINSMAAKSNFIISINPRNGQISWKRPEKVIDLNLKTIYQRIRQYCAKTVELMMTFSGFLFYACKSISFKYFLQHAPESLKRYYLSEKGEIFFYSEIKQYLPFLSRALKPQRNSREHGHNSDRSSLNDSESVLLSSFQVYRKLERGNILYTFSNFCGRQIPYLKEINKMVVLKDLIYPSPRQEGSRSVIQNINIISDQREKEIILKEGCRIKTTVIPIKFTCVQTEEPSNKKSIFNIKEEKMMNDKKKDLDEVIIDKYMIVKQPLNTKFQSKFNKIQYQKQILNSFRGDYCPYLPKYYQTTQENTMYKHSLIIEYLQSLSLHEVTQIKKSTLSQISKLRILMHLSNALRFLQNYEIVHIDLSPNNIFVVADYMVKIIDFGESYCQRVTVKQGFSQKQMKNDQQFRYNPGKTYMFSSPQVYKRSTGFTSKQDMYSFGVLCFKLFFGYYPLSCSEENLERLLKNGDYMESFIFAPEQMEDLGNSQILLVIINLVMKLMNPKEESRPFSVWAHFIFKKLVMAQRM